jgi:hypothetical protein
MKLKTILLIAVFAFISIRLKAQRTLVYTAEMAKRIQPTILLVGIEDEVTVFAQKISLEIRMDSTAISSYSVSAKGSLNIHPANLPSVKKVIVTMMMAKRPVFTTQFNSIKEFNQSNIAVQIRASAYPGNSRVMIELQGLNIVKVLPIVD